MEKHGITFGKFGPVILAPLFFSFPAFATAFICGIEEIPPMGVMVDLNQFMKTFSFVSADIPSEKIESFNGFRVTIHSEGQYLSMTLTDSKQESAAAFASNARELRARLGERAEAFCIDKNMIRNAKVVHPPDF